MAARRLCSPAPGPLEDYAVQFNALWHSRAQRQSFRTYLTGLLAPRERHKTLTALAGAGPLVQANAAPVQQLQFILSEAAWDAEALAARTLQSVGADPLTAPTKDGVLVIDDTGDRKEGHATDHVARQYLGSVGKIDNGIVAVTSLWANEQRYFPLHVASYTPTERLPAGKYDPAFHTKPHIALALIEQAQAAAIPFQSIVADCCYGDYVAFEAVLLQRHLPYVLARKGNASRGRAREDVAHSFKDAAEEVPARQWTRIVRCFRDGHAERWWAAELTLFGYEPDRPVRTICAITDRRTMPDLSTWYLTTNLPLARVCQQAPVT